VTQTATLVRQELDLAKAELSVKGRQAGIGAGMFGAAGLIGLFAVGALTACLVLLLAPAVTAWPAALIVAAAYLGSEKRQRHSRYLSGRRRLRLLIAGGFS
jgi:hypothetical protein